MRGALGNVTGQRVGGGRRIDALSDISRAGERSPAIAFLIAAAVFRLRDQTDIPDPAIVAGEFQQRAVLLILGDSESHDQALADGINHRFRTVGIILIDDRGDFSVFKFQAGSGSRRATALGDGG